MTNRRESGITLLELLIALGVISIAFMAFAFSQLQSLKATSRSQVLTEVKAAANQALETASAEVLKAVALTDCTSPLCDQEDEVAGTPRYLSFKFIDYYHHCAPGAWDAGLRTTYRTQSSTIPVPDSNIANCSGSEVIQGVNVSWSIRSPVLGGLPEEGVLDIAVTAKHPLGQTLTIGNTITCYDVYPAPKKETPRPCPEPELP